MSCGLHSWEEYKKSIRKRTRLLTSEFSASDGVIAWFERPGIDPENQAAGTEEAISHSDPAHQTPGHLSCSDLGRAQNAGPTEFVPLSTIRVSESERLRPGRCMQPGAGLKQFLAEQPRA